MPTFSNRCWPVWLCGLLAVLCLSLLAGAQTITGNISGTVMDATSGVIAGAAVTLTNEQTNDTRSVTTNDEGRFTFSALQPGVYTVKVEQAGFQTLVRKNNVLSANENLALDSLALSVGQVAEVVTTTAEGATVETASSDLSARLTADQISLISTKGRDITSLLRLIPGTSNDDDIEAVGEGFGTNLPNISGQRGRSAVATIDGLNAAEPSGNNKISMTINQDAVGEVKVLRNNYAAEYGNNGGALINIVSKGGGKEYRGSAYYFLRNEALNATPYFTNKAGLRKPLYRHNIWGVNYGGPLPLPRFGEGGPRLLRNKSFFFISLEKPHTITPTDPVFVTMPTALERIGDFSQSVSSSGTPITVLDPLTGQQFRDPARASASNPQGLNIVPLSRINKSGQALLNFFPLPNAPGGRTLAGAAYNYVAQQSVDVPKHSYVIRFDVKPSNKDSIYVKWQWWTSDNEGLGTSGWPSGDANRWGISSHYLYKDNGWSANWVHIINSRIVNEFNFGMRHDSEGFIPSDGFVERLQRSALNYTAPQLFPQNNRLGTIPRVTNFTSVAGTPANINWLDRWGEVGNDYIRPSFADNLSINRGEHNYKFGAYFERLLNGEAPGGSWSGTFNFGTATAFTTSLGSTNYAYANALLGNFNSYSEGSARPFTNLEIKVLQWYGQDEWRVKRNLTLNYGLRMGYHTPLAQIDGQGSNFDPARYNPATAPLLYLPVCTVALTAAACPTANRRAIDPRNPTVLLTNTNLVGTFVKNADGTFAGNINDGLAIGTDPNTPRGYRITKAIDWEPRIGFAWDIWGRQKTVLRGMGGIYHTPRPGGGTTGGNLVNNPPINRTLTVNFGNIDQLASLVGTALSSPSSVNAVEVRSHTPAVYNFSLGVQQDIGSKTVMEISYVGSFARHLGERRNINQVPDTAKFIDVHPENRNPFSAVTQTNGPHSVGALADNLLRPYRGFGDIIMTMWDATSNYNGLQVQVNRRYTRGFQYGVAYTYSKTFDYGKDDDSSDVSLGRPYKAFNYGPADFDQTHIFTVNYIYDIPSVGRRWDNRFARGVLDNWQISGTTSYATGKPKTFGTGTGLNWTFSSGTYTKTASGTCAPGFIATSSTQCSSQTITDFTGGDINARPVVICDPNRRPGTFAPDGSPYLIDTACFAKPGTAGAIGNLQRNLIRLPSTFNTDVAMFKNFRIGEKRSIQLRWETYNLFNRANFSDINGAMTFAVDTGVPLPTGGSCPTGFALAPGSVTQCAGPTFGQVLQTNSLFGTARAARAPRVMQASIRINF
ncbi:MAG: carboxypeptidase regulatory-like domain-containing protein [Pyrinomonadaceae bacterium]